MESSNPYAARELRPATKSQPVTEPRRDLHPPISFVTAAVSGEIGILILWLVLVAVPQTRQFGFFSGPVEILVAGLFTSPLARIAGRSAARKGMNERQQMAAAGLASALLVFPVLYLGYLLILGAMFLLLPMD